MAGGGAGGGADSELVPLSDGDAYGATTREESEGVKLEDFKPDAPLWVLDRTIREKEQLKFQKLIEAASAKAPGRCSKCLETCAPCLACGAVTCSVCIPQCQNQTLKTIGPRGRCASNGSRERRPGPSRNY
mmetsp:Transcript_15516/g.48027  ORF Transcript_15516/g.48027 Transcript_15516/m.48027 type:complete len:131 (-) Transcript_15516:1010-1402(-)